MKKKEKNLKIPSEHLLKFGIHGLDKRSHAHLLVETAKSCYVMARPILNTPALWYYPASLFVMHHSLESFIKAFLLKENIHFEHGQKGHKLIYLVKSGSENSKKLEFLKEILQDQVIKELLNSLDGSYNSNKYWEVGFNARIISIVDIFDKLISIFTEQFHLLYGNKKKEASIDVPEELADLIERNRKYETTLCILPKYEN